MWCQVNEDLIWSNWSTLHFFLAIHQLLHLLVVAEGCVQIALDVNLSFVHILRHWAACNQHRETEETIAGHCYCSSKINIGRLEEIVTEIEGAAILYNLAAIRPRISEYATCCVTFFS